MYNITNLLKKKNIFGMIWRILLVCKQEIRWFWYKACNVYIVRVQVKYLWAWQTNWTCTAILPHVTVPSLIPTFVRMSLTSSYRPACDICVYSILLLSNSFILLFSKISRHWHYKVPTVLYNNCLFFKANMLCLC